MREAISKSDLKIYKRREFKKNIKTHYQLLIMLLIPLIWLLIFKYGPMYGLLIAFKDYDVNLGIMGSEWVGFSNFIKFFNNYMFGKVVKNTLVLNLYYLFAGWPLPILLALTLNSAYSKRFSKTVQMSTYMPYFISTVVLVGIMIQFLNPKVGLIANIAELFGVEAKDFMADPKAFPHLYVWSGIWQNSGWKTIVYLAALSAVDNNLHEAAMIDGASRFQRVLRIDLPCIAPTAAIMLILSAGQVMELGFEKIFLMQNTLNSSASEVIKTFIYKTGLSSSIPDLPMAAAIGMFNSLISLVLIITVNKVAKKISNTGLF